MSGGKPEPLPPHQRTLRMGGGSAGSLIFPRKGGRRGRDLSCIVRPPSGKMSTRNVVGAKGEKKIRESPTSLSCRPLRCPSLLPPNWNRSILSVERQPPTTWQPLPFPLSLKSPQLDTLQKLPPRPSPPARTVKPLSPSLSSPSWFLLLPLLLALPGLQQSSERQDWLVLISAKL